jgi:hypothetical protein
LGLMVLPEFIRTIYHEVEIHESGAFEKLHFGRRGRFRHAFPLVTGKDSAEQDPVGRDNDASPERCTTGARLRT